MKKKLFLILILFILIPYNVYAISDSYNDNVYDIVNVEKEENKINLYLFHSRDCSHCAAERKWLKGIKKDYKDYLNVYEYEVTYDEDNAKLMEIVSDKLSTTSDSVPFTIIGDDYYTGFSETTASILENKIKEYSELENNPNELKLPLLGIINMHNISIPLVAIILGFIDGFNPCAMWILLFLINMLLNVNNKKKRWILGLTFLIVSGLVYFISMLGINLVLGIATINWMKKIIAIFILIAGLFNLKKYLKTRKEVAGCTVVDDKKRKKLITRMKKIINNKSFILSLIGIIILATSVNLIELACSLGFPVIFTEILSINNVVGLTKIIYLLIYILFYMLDDIVVFSISMFTLEATGITNKYNKLCTLISGLIMMFIGLLLIFKPEWLMLNF